MILSLLLAFLSAILLGFYDFFKKLSLEKNTVIPVLFLSSLSSAIFFYFLTYILSINFQIFKINIFDINLVTHLLFALKSVIVGLSWILAYFAIKNLPLTVASPIRASGPVWTLFGAIIVFGEKMSTIQWIGIGITLIFYYLFGIVGEKEGLSFKNNKWILYMTVSTMIGSISSLYDKFLVANYNRILMQMWYHIYMVIFIGMFLLFTWKNYKVIYKTLKWRWTIPLIGIVLSLSDLFYFLSLSYPNALISTITTIRRGSVVVSFTLGAFFLNEKNVKYKAITLIGILTGIFIIILFGN